ncbi:MAG: hypothetical protein ACI8QZ_003380 [Chlamydiales bacterium]|jgi:hypothetical protein
MGEWARTVSVHRDSTAGAATVSLANTPGLVLTEDSWDAAR